MSDALDAPEDNPDGIHPSLIGSTTVHSPETRDTVPTAAGLDLSLTGSGVAFANGECRLFSAPKPITTLPVREQFWHLEALAGQIVACVRSKPVRTVVVEGLDMANSYGGSIERVWLWGSVVHELDMASVSVYVAPSGRVKMYATGSGAASKGEVIEAITRRWPRFDHRGNDNLADAAAMAMMAVHIQDGGLQGMPLFEGHPCVDLPKANLRALQGEAVRHIGQPPPPKKKR